MALFEKVSEHVVASAGAKTLHPVADLNSAERYKTLCMVMRKKSFWFWKSPSMVPTFVTLNGMLVKGKDIEAQEKQFTLIKKFEEKPNLNLSGSIDVSASLAKKIAAQTNIKLSGDDKMELVVSLGDILKCEIPYEDLREAMVKNPIDITHPLYVEAAKQSPKSSLCIVLEELSTKEDGSVKEDDDKKIAVEGGGKAGPNSVLINVKAAGSAESTDTKSFTIPPGTPLAYGCIEISVDLDGNVKLHDTEDTLDDSAATLELPEDPFVKIKSELGPLINSHHVHKLQEEMKSLLRSATETDFRVMHILLYFANSESSMSVKYLKHLLGVDIPFAWKEFMNLFNFSIKEDANEGTIIVFPLKIDADLLKACLALVDSILDCHQNNWKELPDISHNHTLVLMKIIEQEFQNKTNSLNDHGVSSMLKSDPLTLEFLENCEFKKSTENTLIYSGNNSYKLLDVYAIMYFLSTDQKHCCIL